MSSNDIDNHVDDKLAELFSNGLNKSFVLFAGAGSGKTRSLVKLLEHIKETSGDEFVRRNKSVAVITFTNAATDEITRRLGISPAFHVATIHSFMWSIISPFQKDVIVYMIEGINEKINDLEEKQTRARNTNTSTYLDRQQKIDRYRSKIQDLETTKSLNYNPVPGLDHDNTINHTEVISIGTKMLSDRALFRKIVTQKYPVLLVDECQDTDKHFVDALINLSKDTANPIQIGFFGDVNQQIYLSGKDQLLESIPTEWEKVYKQMNHRSSKRVVELNNMILNGDKTQRQLYRDDSISGGVRVVVVDVSAAINKQKVENDIHEYMSSLSNHSDWITDISQFPKNELPPRASLILEHKMAASRMGFGMLFNILHANKRTRDDLASNSLTPLNFFGKTILPLISELRAGNQFGVMNLLRKKRSHLLLKLKNNEIANPFEHLKIINTSVNELFKLWERQTPVLRDIVNCVNRTDLFKMPSDLLMMLNDTEYDDDGNINVWQQLKEISFEEVENYELYHSEQSPFLTHQGVKGLEYNHVMAIIDESESNHRSFSYDKLFGLKGLSDRDRDNIAQGKDNVLSRTERLFYVICSRAKKDLVIVYYTDNHEEARQAIQASGYVSDDELLSYEQVVESIS